MNNIFPERASFWRESLRDLVPFIRAQWQWVVVFSALVAIAQLFAFMSYDSKEIMKQVQQVQGDTAKSLEIFAKHLPSVALSTIADACIIALSTYVFTVLYLKQFAKADAPFTAANFFFWLGKSIQKYLILICPILLAAAALGVVLALNVSEPVRKIATSLFVGFSLLWIVYFVCGFYFLFLVTPLAILRRQLVLKTSAQMTKNHIFRIWWEYVILMVILFVLFSPLFYGQMVVVKYQGETSSMAKDLFALVQGLWMGVTEAAMAIYTCTVYRILMQEQKN